MIITVTLNPAVDKTLLVPGFAVDEVNRVQEVLMDPGGKGINVSKSVQALGGDTMCLGILGGETGNFIKTALDALKLRHDFVDSGIATRTNTKIVDLRLGTNTDINEAGAPAAPWMIDAMTEKLLSTAKSGDTVVIAGKNPPQTPSELLAVWTKQLRQIGVRVCVDTVGEPMRLALREKPAVIKPNKEELCELMGRSLISDEDVIHAAKELVASGVELVAVSLGADGAVFVTADKTVRSYSPKVKVVSTVGAGDSMMAAIAYYLEIGCPLEEVARRATAVATATVQVSGSQPAALSQITPLIDKIVTKTI